MLVAAIQMNTRNHKEVNVQKAEALIDAAAKKGAVLAVLPETFNFLGPDEEKPAEAESIPGPTTERLMERAAHHAMFIIAGSIFEVSPQPGKLYNTSVLINPDGRIVAKYRKIHLFDIDVEGEAPYRESALVIPGKEIVSAETSLGTIGLTICYDLRFPELYRVLSYRGSQIISIPSAFTLHTGLAHWEALIRARAIENLSYVIAPGQIGTHPVNRECFGNSMIVDPWGTVVTRAPNSEAVVVADIDLDYQKKVRENLPSLTHRRTDIYGKEDA
jgi:predicted amidohydrolase